MPPGQPNDQPQNDQPQEGLPTLPDVAEDGLQVGQFLVDRRQSVLGWDPGMIRLTGLAAAQAVDSPLATTRRGPERPWLAEFLLNDDLEGARAFFGAQRIWPLPWGGGWLAQGTLAGPDGRPREALEIALPAGSPDTVAEMVCLGGESGPATPDLETLRILAEHVPAGVALMQDGRLVMVNQSFSTMFGYSRPSELVNQPPGSLLAAHDKVRQKQAIANINQYEPGKARFQWNGINRDGRKFWFEGRPTPIVWNGRPAVLSFVMDITEFKQREELFEQESRELRQENLRLKNSIDYRVRLGNIIGRSGRMQELFEGIIRAAASEFGIVIYGETGTGKELVAKAVHALSPRAQGPFVAVNCGAVPEELFEAELFGYRKGAFTGAYADKPGYLDQAKGGILFLDEVAEITLPNQAKLLRALGSGEYSAVGSPTPTQADFRVIAATKRDLAAMARQGTFRHDLFYRIHVIPLHLPPLRERKEDIPFLVEHFLGSRPEGPQKMISQDLAKLLDYHWPGNVRELRNTLERYLAFGNLDFLPSGPAGAPRLGDGAPAGDHELRPTLNELERQLILHALAAHGWNRSRTALALGLPRKTLFRKMAKLGIEEPARGALPPA